MRQVDKGLKDRGTLMGKIGEGTFSWKNPMNAVFPSVPVNDPEVVITVNIISVTIAFVAEHKGILSKISYK